MIQIELFGTPVPWAAARKSGRHFYDIRHADKEAARWQIRAQYRDALLTGPIEVWFTFWKPIPKSTSSIRRKQMLAGIILPITKPDATNMQKLYEDCLSGIVFADDRQVVDIHSKKRYSEKPGVLIRIQQHSINNLQDYNENNI